MHKPFCSRSRAGVSGLPGLRRFTAGLTALAAPLAPTPLAPALPHQQPRKM